MRFAYDPYGRLGRPICEALQGMTPIVKSPRFTGWWTPGATPPEYGYRIVAEGLARVTHPLVLLQIDNRIAVGRGGILTLGEQPPAGLRALPVYGYTPPLHPENLGDPGFKQRHRLRYAYVAGAMANGITSVTMVSETGRAGMLGFFGAAGLVPDEIDRAIGQLQSALGETPFGLNLIHTPNDPELELAVVRLYLQRGISLVSASAYLDLTLPLVYYRVKGIHRDSDDRIVCPNRIVGKVSRVELATQFLSPPPPKLLGELLNRRWITPREAELAAGVPMVGDLTAEADSGGHTDNRPALALLPTMLSLRDRLVEKFSYPYEISVGLGGGIATPDAVAAAFALGAAFVVTGTVNQACVEAGTSVTVRQMLAEAGQADVTMAPAADMFEMGVKVQVLKRGTLFPFRAAKLYDLYNRFAGFESLPDKDKTIIERDILRASFAEEWERTQNFFRLRDPSQIRRAESDPKHKMALVFRSYLGQSSNWATHGKPSRKIDYQIWCGPGMGAFNAWTQGSFLEKPQNRQVVTVGLNLLLGAAIATRQNWLRCQGVLLAPGLGRFRPLELPELQDLMI